MKNEVHIEEKSSLDNIEYDIVTMNEDYPEDECVLARCWDCLLAERIRDAVEDYMKENYKINCEDN